MVLEPDTGRCASEDTGPPRGVDCEIHIGCIKNKALCGNLSLVDAF